MEIRRITIPICVHRCSSVVSPRISLVLQVLRLHLRDQVLREVVQAYREDAQVVNEPVVGEHGGNGHYQAGDGRDEGRTGRVDGAERSETGGEQEARENARPHPSTHHSGMLGGDYVT